MSEIDNVVPGEPIEADWGNDLRDRAIQRYIDQAALDASVVLPVVGDPAYLTDPGEFKIHDGTDWIEYQTVPDAEATFVFKAGDTMTGDLTLALGVNLNVGEDGRVGWFDRDGLPRISGGNSVLNFGVDGFLATMRFYMDGVQTMRIVEDRVTFGTDANAWARINVQSTPGPVFVRNGSPSNGLGFEGGSDVSIYRLGSRRFWIADQPYFDVLGPLTGQIMAWEPGTGAVGTSLGTADLAQLVADVADLLSRVDTLENP